MVSPVVFVEQLEIESPDSHFTSSTDVQFSVSKSQGLVDAGSLVSFVGNVGKQQRTDVLNSTLFAQLAADKKFNRQRQAEKWFEFYQFVLSKLGWNIQEYHFEEYKSHGEKMQISEEIVSILRATLSKDELEVVERTIKSLQSSENEPCWNVFSQKCSAASSNANLQILTCKVDSSGQITMSLGSFHFSAKSMQPRWLWFHYNSANIIFYKCTPISTLNITVYDAVRDEIIKKLGDYTQRLIRDLKI